MWQEIAAWQETLKERPDLSAKTIALYTQDARRFATWLQQEHAGLKATEVTATDAKTYRDHQGFTPQLVLAHLNVESLPLALGTGDGVHPVSKGVIGRPLHRASPNLG